jgi:hypothetical protein
MKGGERSERSECEVRVLPRGMFIPEAVEYVMDYSGKRETECGFSAVTWTDRIVLFAEGLGDCVRYPSPGPITFHTHPFQSDFCHPSPDDVSGGEEGDVGIVGCPRLGEVIYFEGEGSDREGFEEIFERNEEIEEEFERSQKEITGAIEGARKRGDRELAERLDWDLYEAGRKYKRDKIMNQMRFKRILQESEGFLKDFRKGFPMERILELKREQGKSFRQGQFKDMAEDPDWRETMLDAHPEWKDDFEEYLRDRETGPP